MVHTRRQLFISPYFSAYRLLPTFTNNRYEFPRPALVVEGNVKLPNGSELEMMAITVHLKAFMNSKSRSRRTAAMRSMLSFLDNVQKLYPNKLLVLMGDLMNFTIKILFLGI